MANDHDGAAFGVIGLGVMGANLALNVADHGFRVAVWNRETEVARAFGATHAAKGIVARDSLEDFVAVLERPRRILMMIKAGSPVDEMLEKLLPLLAPDDVLIDGGNTWFEDTRRREARGRERGIHFVGMGVSGGEEGARNGPSLMPGGTRESWLRLQPILESIAAKTDSGPCVTHVGPDGAGHFVKMVHNGIEYGDMQLMAEIYDVLRRGAGLDAPALGQLFESWNRTELESFLVEITAKIFRKRDATSDRALIDLVADRAGQKGTGRLTVTLALELGVAIPTIGAAVDARVISSNTLLRTAAGEQFAPPDSAIDPADAETARMLAHDALLLGRICAYAQGLELIEHGSKTYSWGIDPMEIARIWKGGCIIRSRLLDLIRRAYAGAERPAHLLVAPDVAALARRSEPALRGLLALAVRRAIPVPALAASLAWFDAVRSSRLPQNLTQAQRDAFGAHTYQRVDDTAGRALHSEWL
jgi:6-phosphogluconate dehydrogenase